MPSEQPQQQPSDPHPHRSTSRRRLLAGAGGAAAGAFALTAGFARPATALAAIPGGPQTGAAESSAMAPGAAGSGRVDPRVRQMAGAMLRHMSLREKVGQLFVVEVGGQEPDEAHPRNKKLYGVDTPAEVIAKYLPGGVIYFDARRGCDNMRTPAQVAGLSNGLQHSALNTGARLPLHISVDQEGGSVVHRMLEPATQMPGNMALAAGRSREDTHLSAEIIGSELAAMGLNQNYAPVSDVNINPDNPVIGVRSFGSDPELCAELVTETVRGLHRARIASAAKHFPGHGDTDTDSHTGLPVISHTREQLHRTDLPPFRAAIAAGVDTIMTAHIVVPSLDPSRVPATMSHPIVTGLLREELGFEGLIATDALDMGGATADFPPDIAPVRALQAGCDQLVLAPKTDTAHAAVIEAVRSGAVTTSRLDDAVLRVLEHKLRNGLFKRGGERTHVDETRAERVVGSRRHAADNTRVTARTLTLIRNEGRALPLSDDTRSLLVTGWGKDQTATLAATIARRPGQSATPLETGAVPTGARIYAAAKAARGHDAVLVLCNAAEAVKADRTDKGAAQARLIKALMATGKPVIAVATQNPYDIRRFPTVPAYLATYGYGTPSLTALAGVLYGDIDPRGKLPVSIPAHSGTGAGTGTGKILYPFGHGLSY
jgi:beta-glucosidase-like glycosyl hydrolase